jgi:hypothetical protein
LDVDEGVVADADAVAGDVAADAADGGIAADAVAAVALDGDIVADVDAAGPRARLRADSPARAFTG